MTYKPRQLKIAALAGDRKEEIDQKIRDLYDAKYGTKKIAAVLSYEDDIPVKKDAVDKYLREELGIETRVRVVQEKVDFENIIRSQRDELEELRFKVIQLEATREVLRTGIEVRDAQIMKLEMQLQDAVIHCK